MMHHESFMVIDSSQLTDSVKQKFMNHHFEHPEAAAGIAKNQNLEESLVATRNQNKTMSDNTNHTNNKRPRTDLSPIIYTTANQIGGKLPTRPMVVLLDSGSSHTMMKQTSLPHGAIPTRGKPKRTTTTNGVFTTKTSVIIEQLKFPEFRNHFIKEVTADVFHSPTCCYDIILGREVLDLIGAKMDFRTNIISCMGRDIPMKSMSSFSSSPVQQLHNHFLHEESEDFDIIAELYADDIVIKDRKYQAVTPDEVVRQLPHLSQDQKNKLKLVFEKYKTVFDGKLGKHPIAKIDIELIPGAKPIYQNPYPVSFKRKPLFDRELNNMIADGVFTKIGESEWGFPSFIIPKKDGRV